MPISRARSVEVLYDDVSDHDLVIVPDAPLASAINRRIDRPHFGTFATTPRRLAAGRREHAEDRTAFLEVIDRTEHDWKSVSYAIGNVLQCWEHHGDREAVLKYDAYADDVTRDVVEILGDLKTTSGELQATTVDEDSVAVIGEPSFTELERSIFPADYDHIPLFDDASFDLPEFHIFDAASDIVDSILDTVEEETADDVAIVLDRGSQYSPLLESALESASIPFYGGPGFIDQPEIRGFMALCRTAFRGESPTVSDVRPVLNQLDVTIPVEHDQKRLQAINLPETEWVRKYCTTIDSRTFAEAWDAYASRIDAPLDSVLPEFETLGIGDLTVTAERFSELAFYLQAYTVPFDRENEGVLLADANASGYVDRPVVFHVGLDESWTHTAPQRPWVDTEAQYDRYLQRFQLLLQSGAEQYYLVQDTAGGQPVTPCLYLTELLDQDFERFSDLTSVSHTRIDEEPSDGFDPDPVEAESSSLEMISNSSLKGYANCPRDYCFDRLLDTPDQDYFREGTLFHDFAEYYVNHPEHVDDDTIAEVVDVMDEEVAPFVDEADRLLRRRNYRLGLETILEFLDDRGPDSDEFLTATSGWGSNFFADYFGRPVDSPLTERWFKNSNIGTKGKIDLVLDPDHLLDYKSGSKDSAYDVVKQAAVDPPADTPDFQAALYLSHYRTERPDEPIEFTFFYFTETIEDLVRGDHDLEDTLTTVEYYPWTFDDHVGSRAAYDAICGTWNDCTAVLEDLGFEQYSEIMEELSFPETTEKEELQSSEFASVFSAAVKGATSSEVDAEKGADQAIRLLNRVRSRAFFREDLDEMEAFVDQHLGLINRYRAGDERFPIEGPGGEPNYRRVDNRDLLLEGER